MEIVLIAYIILLICADFAMNRRQSAGSLFVIINLASLSLGFHFYGINTDGASIGLEMPTESLRDIYIEGLILVALFATARMTYLVISGGAVISASPAIEDVINSDWIIPLASISFFLLLVGSGIVELFWRDVYMVETSQIIKSLATVGSLASLYLLGVRGGMKETTGYSHWFLITLFAVAFFGYSSRMLALTFLLFFLGYTSRSTSWLGKLGMGLSLVAFPILIHFSLYMRSQSMQGLVPAFSQLVSGSIFSDFSLSAAFNNVIGVNFVITALTAITSSLDFHYFVTSLNPLPGYLTDWYEIGGSLNESTPYSMMGEWIGYGMFPAAGFFIFLALLYARIDLIAFRGDLYFSTIGFIVMNLATIGMLQYHTRTSTRLIYYLLAGRLLIFIAQRYIKPLISSQSTPRDQAL